MSTDKTKGEAIETGVRFNGMGRVFRLGLCERSDHISDALDFSRHPTAKELEAFGFVPQRSLDLAVEHNERLADQLRSVDDQKATLLRAGQLLIDQLTDQLRSVEQERDSIVRQVGVIATMCERSGKRDLAGHLRLAIHHAKLDSSQPTAQGSIADVDERDFVPIPIEPVSPPEPEQPAEVKTAAGEGKPWPTCNSCSFCGKPNSEVARVYQAGPVSICNECVALTLKVEAERAAVPPPIPPDAPKPVSPDLEARLVAALRDASPRFGCHAYRWLADHLESAKPGKGSR